MIDNSHQTLMFSATIPPTIEKLSQTILHRPIFISIGHGTSDRAAINVRQTVIWVEEKSKKKKLFEFLNSPKHYKPPIVIFVSSKIGADLLSTAINKHYGEEVSVSISSDKTQEERTTILKSFIDGLFQIIVSTPGILGRGLDLLHVSQVVNFDMANTISEYIHQIGRTGRLGSPGFALTFINNEHKQLFPDLLRILKESNSFIPKELENSPYAHPLPNPKLPSYKQQTNKRQKKNHGCEKKQAKRPK